MIDLPVDILEPGTSVLVDSDNGPVHMASTRVLYFPDGAVGDKPSLAFCIGRPDTTVEVMHQISLETLADVLSKVGYTVQPIQ